MIEFKNLTAKKIKREAFAKLYKKIFLKQFELSLVFAPPALMSSLNKKYRGKNKSANVLAFLLEKNRGEIFLNIREKNLPYLFVHGALHLKGYHHKNNKDANIMENSEKKLLPLGTPK